MNLKVRVDHLMMLGGAALLLVAGAVFWQQTRPDPERAELDQGLEELREKKTGRSRAGPRFVRPFHAMGGSGERGGEQAGLEPVPAFEPPAQKDPGDLGPDESIDEFQLVMSELEAAAADGRKLDQRESDELYNRATGSFTALSTWIDGADASERALMEDAYQQMMSLMRELEIQPTAHDPDGARPRR